MTNRACPIGYFDCHSCEHWQDLECCHKDALCPVCGMNMSGWEEMTGETAHAHIETHRVSHELTLQEAVDQALGPTYLPNPTLLFSGRIKASELQRMILQAVLGEWYDKGYRLVEEGEDTVTLYYAGYDDAVEVFGRKVPGIIPTIKRACYLHALKQREG